MLVAEEMDSTHVSQYWTHVGRHNQSKLRSNQTQGTVDARLITITCYFILKRHQFGCVLFYI